MEKNTNNVRDFLARVENIKTSGGVDLSAAEDLSLAVMNLIALEEHLFFTGAKTKDDSYYDVSSEVRSMRTRLMKDLVDRHEGETWCATKHLLSAAMRLIETGNRYRAEKQPEKANGYYEDAYRVYGIFWALKTKLISAHALGASAREAGAKGWSLETLVGKLADCCDEK